MRRKVVRGGEGRIVGRLFSESNKTTDGGQAALDVFIVGVSAIFIALTCS